MEKTEIYDSALRKYGLLNQVDVCIEELSELTQQLVKYKRGVGDTDRLAEEIADVEVMTEQIKQFLGIEKQVDSQKLYKIKRLLKRLFEV